MKIKSAKFLFLMVAAVVVTIFAVRQFRPKDHAVALPVSSASAPAAPKAKKDTIVYNKEIVRKHEAKPYLRLRGGPDAAISKIAVLHPEFGLSTEAAVDLQLIYSDYYGAFMDISISRAKVVAKSDSTSEIHIPAVAAEGQIIKEELLKDINAYFYGAAPEGLSDLVLFTFSTDSNAFGSQVVDMVVTSSSDPRYVYSLTKNLSGVYPADPTIKVSSTSQNILTAEDLKRTPYVELSALFPKK